MEDPLVRNPSAKAAWTLVEIWPAGIFATRIQAYVLGFTGPVLFPL